MYLRLLLLIWSVLLATWQLKSQATARSGKDYAVFFYISTYDQVGWTQLPEAKSESERIAAELSGKYGFTTEIIAGPSKKQILDKLDEYNRRQYGPGDQVLFFFSMHGHYDEKSERGYLIPKEGKVEDAYGDSWLSYDELGTRLSRNTCRHVLLMLDACYSGSFGIRNKGGKPDEPVYTEAVGCAQKIERALRETSRKYFSSGNKSSRTPARSTFASRILETLRKGGSEGILYSRDFDYALSGTDNPKPESGTFRGHEENGDFVFVLKGACGSGSGPEDVDAVAFKSAQNRNTVEAYDYYLSAFPQGRFKKQAEDAKGVLQEERAWQTAQRLNTPDAYQGYLDIYPYGRYAASARERVKPTIISVPTGPTTTATPNPAFGMVTVPGGTFQMGDVMGDKEETDETVHSVTLGAFQIGAYEVTFEEYDAFCTATKREKPADEGWGRGKRPVINVSWEDVVAYCNWRSKQEGFEEVYTINGSRISANWQANGYRLPTEAEWEYAARAGGKKVRFGNGKDIADPKEINFDGSASYKKAYSVAGEYRNKTLPVGSFSPNALGLYDMSGNVWEWCWDWYGNYSTSAQTNPKGANTGSRRVMRGGSWGNDPQDCRVAYRGYSSPGSRNADFGFRLSRTL